MFQYYGSTATNGVWVIPGSHKQGKLDIKGMIAANGGSDRLPEAVPMVCKPGDVVIAIAKSCTPLFQTPLRTSG